ncbi:MAG: hypothetical protein GY765_02115 [bacterium]|nr:hypothetical protein [bacterium]
MKTLRLTDKRLKIPSLMAVVLAALFVVFSGIPAHGQEGDEPSIYEEVEVVNVNIPVRVFRKGKPVGGLQKDDFKLFVGGKEKKIHGFYETRKKMGTATETPGKPDETNGIQAEPNPRLFVFIFNISQYHKGWKKDIDTIFSDILRIHDRYIVITNNFMLKRTIMMDPETEKERLNTILREEATAVQKAFAAAETELSSITGTLISRLNDPAEKERANYPKYILREYFQEYGTVLGSMKSAAAGRSAGNCVRVARYLQKVQGEKWVLCFHQLSKLPILEKSAVLGGNIDTGMLDLDVQADEGIAGIANLFINTGATVHTLLVNTIPRALNHYSYKTFTTFNEGLLRKVARLTGGTVTHRKPIKKFLKKIAPLEDICYNLTYVPGKTDKKNEKIKIVLHNKKGHRLTYNSTKNGYLYNRLSRRFKQDFPNVKIEALTLSSRAIQVTLTGIRTVPSPTNKSDKYGLVDTVMTVMDKESHILWKARKRFKCSGSKAVFQATPPQLPKGEYNLTVEVEDVFTHKTDASGTYASIRP